MPSQSLPKYVDSVTVRQIFESYGKVLQLDLVTGQEGLDRTVHETSLNRPSLPLTGYFKHFAAKRIQLFGAGEMAYLKDLNEDRQTEVLSEICRRHIPCMVVSRNLAPTKAMLRVCEEAQVPLFRTPLSTRIFLSHAAVLMERKFAPRVTEHGTTLDIKGIGTLIRGRSGVGKSECALALIERGHSLVADDLTFITLINDDELMATSSHLNRGYMECRGLGIINISELFGVRSVRKEKRIDLVVTFTEGNVDMEEDRTGLEENFYNILDIHVPHIEILVRPGRDMARLVEVAALIQASKRMGHNSAKEFNDRLIAEMQKNISRP